MSRDGAEHDGGSGGQGLGEDHGRAADEMDDALVCGGDEERAVGAHRGCTDARHHGPADTARFEIDADQIPALVDGVGHPLVEVDTDRLTKRRGVAVGSPPGGNQALGNECLDGPTGPRKPKQGDLPAHGGQIGRRSDLVAAAPGQDDERRRPREADDGVDRPRGPDQNVGPRLRVHRWSRPLRSMGRA
jgi:hypothetical protein